MDINIIKQIGEEPKPWLIGGSVALLLCVAGLFVYSQFLQIKTGKVTVNAVDLAKYLPESIGIYADDTNN